MGSLCGQVNMAWRMNRSAVTLFLFPLSKSRLDWNEGRPEKCQTKNKPIFSLKLVKYQWFSTPKVYQLHMIKTTWVHIFNEVKLPDSDTNEINRLLWLFHTKLISIMLYLTSQWYTYCHNRNLITASSASPQADPSLSVSGLCHPSIPHLLSLSSIVGNISHYNSSSRTGCHLGALCSVFVGLGSCFWESDREQAKGLFPLVQSLQQRDWDSAHRSLSTGREDRRCGWEGRT